MDKQPGETLYEYLTRIVSTVHNDLCWSWPGHISQGPRKGYSAIGVQGKVRYAHQVAYELRLGNVPIGLELDHTCLNKWCWNPSHLEAVTHAENCYRAGSFSTHCKHGHAMTQENTRFAKQSYSDRIFQQRRTCKREWIRARRAGLTRGYMADDGRIYGLD